MVMIPAIIDSQPDGTIPQGVRNAALTSYAGALRARGFAPERILVALREMNRARCAPPLQDLELRNIAKSAARWKPYPTRRGQQQSERVVHIQGGCFDPRPEVCGFDAAAVVESDRTLGLWWNHRRLYAFLAGMFGPWGCHPSQRTIGETLGMRRQHVARHVARLERAGLILVDAGDYRQAERKFGAQSYHFLRHALFAEHFTRNGLPVFNDLEGLWHHCDEFSTGEEKTLHIFQRVTEIMAHRGAVVPISHRALAAADGVAGGKRDPLSIEPFEFELSPDYFAIKLYVECAARCGGCRIEYTDGTLKRYGCSCEAAAA